MKHAQSPIAIIGMACRFPGEASNPEKFWDLLINQKDAMVPIPETRWNADRHCSDNPATKGKMYNRLGAFISQPITEFDPGLFSIPPREAECLDPQQRLLLEVSWEAMENAGQNVQALAGSNVGVFVGGFTLDHLINQMSAQGRSHIGSHTAVGSTLTVLSNRISHTFDFRGPSISMDTACSSSLVAFHQACLAIKNGDCHMSLVGGVNIMMRPEYPITMCKGGFLAKDSHCKSFDERADGYARGEGAGVVLIKALDQAIADKDPILAVVNASGVNQDGRTHGITVPNPDAQKDLIKRVCSEGKVEPSSVAYVEAHGTGTPVGDPIEADAIGSIYGAGRSQDNPVVIGSLKSNVGHLEAAAGIAGVIKAVLCLQKNEIPALATLNNPNPNIPFEKLGLKLAREKMPLTSTPDLCSIGVNSFGYGGTNAHALISAPKPYVSDEYLASYQSVLSPISGSEKESANDDVIPFSANDKNALNALFATYYEIFSQADASAYQGLVRSLQSRRTPLRERACVIAKTQTELCETLKALVAGKTPDNVRFGHMMDEKQKGPVFVYTGMGPQWWGMGQALYAQEPVFRDTVDEIDRLFTAVAGYSILEEMMKDEDSSRMADTLISAPANFTLQVALTELLKSQGVKPSAVIGHSLGEISSAYVAGAVDLNDAVKIIYYRTKIIKKIAGTGGMLAVAISQEVAESLIEDPKTLSIAAVNSPNMITFAGEEDVLQNLEQVFTEEGIFCRLLKVEVPFHSPMVEPLKDEVNAALVDIVPRKPHTAIYSTVDGKLANDVEFDVHYWFRNMRQAVLFEGAVKDIVDDGYKIFLEVGPHPVLSASLKECFKAYKSNAVTLASLRRGEPEVAQSRLCLAELNVVSNAIDWQDVNGAVPYTPLPNYPWQREELWSEPEAARSDRLARAQSPYFALKTASAKPEWSLEINNNGIPYIQDHRIDDLAVLPGAAYIESFSQLYRHVYNQPAHLTQVQFHSPIVFDEQEWPNVEISYHKETNSAEIHQISAIGSAKLVAKCGFLEPDDELLALPTTNHEDSTDTQRFTQLAEQFAGVESESNAQFYSITDAIGLGYRNDYRSLRDVKTRDTDVFAKVMIEQLEQAQTHCVYPPALDACFQSLLSALFKANWVNGPVVPVAVGSLKLHAPLVDSVYVYSKLVSHSEQAFVCDLEIFDQQGALLAEIKQLTCEPVNRSSEELSVDHINKRTCQYRFDLITAEEASSGFDAQLHDKSSTFVLSSDAEFVRSFESQQAQAVLLPKSADGEQAERFYAEVFSAMGEQASHVYFVPAQSLQANEPDSVRPQMLHVAALLRHFNRDAIALSRANTDSQAQSQFKLTLITECGHKATPDDVVNPAQAALLNFFRVVANESDHIQVNSIDLAELSAQNVAEAMALQPKVDELVCREQGFYEAKLARSEVLTTQETIALTAHEDFALQYQPFVGRAVLTKLTPLADASQQETVCRLSAVKTLGDLVLGSGVQNGQTKGFAIAQGRLTNRIDLATQKGIWLKHSAQLTDETYTASVLPYAFAQWVLNQAGLNQAGLVTDEHSNLSDDTRVVVNADQFGYCLAHLLKNTAATVYVVKDADATPELLAAFDALSSVNMVGLGHLADAFSVDATNNSDSGVSAHLLLGPIQHWLRKAFLGRVCDNSIVIETSALQGKSTADNQAVLNRLACAAQVIKPDAKLLLSTYQHGFRAALQRSITRLENGEVPPLPYSELPAQAWVNGPQPEHALLSLNVSQPITAQYSNELNIHSEKTYVVTGGLGGFGKRVALWLVDQGAQHLVLVGRSGIKTSQDEEFVQLLSDIGLNVRAARCDVAQADQVEQLIHSVRSQGESLGGVFHCAGLLDDKAIVELNSESINQVVQAKAAGAINLHNATQSISSLDLFVMFSSIAADVGNSMQASYVTANGYLDGLVHARRQQGLPANAINWGAIDDVGMVAEDEQVRKHFAQMGVYPIPADEAILVMEEVVKRNIERVTYADIDWNKWGRVEKVAGRSNKFNELVDQQAANEGNDLASELAALSVDDRVDVVSGLICDILAVELNTAAEQIERTVPMVELGVDSLLATSLQMSIEEQFSVAVSVIELAGDGTVDQLATKILDRIAL